MNLHVLLTKVDLNHKLEKTDKFPHNTKVTT
jgi:hypothetical protein